MGNQPEITAHCSWCFFKTKHKRTGTNRLGRGVFECGKCGQRTVVCVVPGCYEMAKGEGRMDDVLCAAHAGEIGSFERLTIRLQSPDEYEELFKRDFTNLGRASKIAAWAGGGALVFAPAAYFAAPAVGGAIGAKVFGLTGAAAVNKGLATLGLGALSTGGFGMAGGVAVVSATGSAIGGTVGGVVANAYIGEIKGFSIEKLQDGSGPGVIVVNGFLSSGTKDQSLEWKNALQQHYPKNPWYLLKWESKRLKDLGKATISAASSNAVVNGIAKLASRATMKGSGLLGPVGTALSLSDVAKNPWHVAMSKAAPTGTLLAEIIARTPGQKKYVLMGHSLGARVVYYCLQSLATQKTKRIKTVHLLGGAVGTGKKEDWEKAAYAVYGTIHNYYSRNDQILKTLYKAGGLFLATPAIGANPIRFKIDGIENHDVSPFVGSHTAYKANSTDFLRN